MKMLTIIAMIWNIFKGILLLFAINNGKFDRCCVKHNIEVI